MNSFCKKILQGYRPSFDEIVSELSPFIEGLTELRSTPQDPQWHAEGDVHTHLSMVISELYQIIDQNQWNLSQSDKLSLILGTALHDIGKPLCTKVQEINGQERMVSPHHEYRGAGYLSFRIPALNLPKPTEHEILSLVACHHMPKKLVIKNIEKPGYMSLARTCSPKKLYLLEIADMKGRTCEDEDLQLDILNLFRISCEEYGVWDAPPYQDWPRTISKISDHRHAGSAGYFLSQAIRDYENGFISTPEEVIPRYFEAASDFNELVLVCGPGGSGKSSWIRRHLPDYTVISMDQLREDHARGRSDQKSNGLIRQLAKDQLKSLLRGKGQKLVWDATALRRDFRKSVLDLGHRYKALTTIIFFQKDLTDIRKGNQDRDHSVPSPVLERQIESFEWPELTEAHRFKIVGKDGQVNFRHGYINEY